MMSSNNYSIKKSSNTVYGKDYIKYIPNFSTNDIIKEDAIDASSIQASLFSVSAHTAISKWAAADMNRKRATPQAMLTSKSAVVSGNEAPGGPVMKVPTTGRAKSLARARTKRP